MKKEFSKNNSVHKLKTHLEKMKTELEKTNSQIELLEKNEKSSEWDKIDAIEGKSILDLKEKELAISKEISSIQKELKKSKSKTLLITELFLLPVVVLLVMVSGIGNDLVISTADENSEFKTRHLIENLRGDTVDTWKSWRLVGTTMNVNIVNARGLADEKIDIIEEAISSKKILQIDDSITHKGPKGMQSTYFAGWKGALENANSEETLYNLPTDFNVIRSYGGEGDVIITLSNLRDSDGFTGYTKSIVDGNEILKSFITIYDVSNLSDEELQTIVRHEFGHALGLGHSTAPEDLMAPTIDMTVPYISECNIDAIVDLYNGIQGSTVCEK